MSWDIILVGVVFIVAIIGALPHIANQESKKTTGNLYTEYPIASSNAFAYLHKEYKPAQISKLAYLANLSDPKLIAHIKKSFNKIGIEAINIRSIRCDSCKTGNDMKKYLSSKGISTVLHITFTDKISKKKGFQYAVFNTYGNVTYASITPRVSQNVWAVFEWYNSDFNKVPFLKTISLKSSINSSYRSLAEGLINLSIFRPFKKKLIIEPN